MKPTARIIHQSSGRTRLQVPDRRRDGDFFTQVHEQLTALPGIESVKTNPLSSSILLLHPESTNENILADIEKLRLFELREAARTSDNDRLDLSSFLNSIPHLEGLFLDQARNRHTILFILLVGLAIREFLKGNIAPPAIPLLIYAKDIALNPKGSRPNPNP